MQLTRRQRDRLETIKGYVPSAQWPHPAFWKDSRTDISLVRRGLVERIDYTTKLGGPSVAGFSATWHLCKITEAGRLALTAGSKP